MSNESTLQLFSKLAAADLSSYQYHAVRITADDTVNLCDGATDEPTGVLVNKPEAAGRGASVCRFGEVPVMLGGTVSAGDKIMPALDGSGHWIASIAGWGTFGEMQEAGVSGEIRKAFIFYKGTASVLSP